MNNASRTWNCQRWVIEINKRAAEKGAFGNPLEGSTEVMEPFHNGEKMHSGLVQIGMNVTWEDL